MRTPANQLNGEVEFRLMS